MIKNRPIRISIIQDEYQIFHNNQTQTPVTSSAAQFLLTITLVTKSAAQLIGAPKFYCFITNSL